MKIVKKRVFHEGVGEQGVVLPLIRYDLRWCERYASQIIEMLEKLTIDIPELLQHSYQVKWALQGWETGYRATITKLYRAALHIDDGHQLQNPDGTINLHAEVNLSTERHNHTTFTVYLSNLLDEPLKPLRQRTILWLNLIDFRENLHLEDKTEHDVLQKIMQERITLAKDTLWKEILRRGWVSVSYHKFKEVN